MKTCSVNYVKAGIADAVFIYNLETYTIVVILLFS